MQVTLSSDFWDGQVLHLRGSVVDVAVPPKGSIPVEAPAGGGEEEATAKPVKGK